MSDALSNATTLTASVALSLFLVTYLSHSTIMLGAAWLISRERILLPHSVKDLITHRTEGRTYIYRPKVQEKEVRRSMVRDVVDRLFQGDASELVSHLLTESQIKPDDLDKVRDLIKAAEKKGGR